MARPKPRHTIEAEASCKRCIAALVRRRGITDATPELIALLTAAWMSGHERGMAAEKKLEAERTQQIIKNLNATIPPDLARIGAGLKAMRDAANANGFKA